MSEHFGHAALRHYAVAARVLGWRPDEFWAATPEELVRAIAPPSADVAPLDRAAFNRLMEHDNDIDRR